MAGRCGLLEKGSATAVFSGVLAMHEEHGDLDLVTVFAYIPFRIRNVTRSNVARYTLALEAWT